MTSTAYPVSKRCRIDELLRSFAPPAFIFLVVYAFYLLSADGPLDGSAHHVYLAQAMLNGTFDLASAGLPDSYNDVIPVGESTYIPFPPGPAILLLPLVAIFGTDVPQGHVAVFLGAANVCLFWYLLGLLRVSGVTKGLMVPFFAIGTVHYYAAATGGVWHYNHVVAVFFLLLAIILLLRRAPLFLTAAALGFAVISRGPTLMAVPFFLWYVYYQREQVLSFRGLLNRAWLKDVALFASGLVPFGILLLFYNFARFDNAFDSGYQAVYESYVNRDVAYSYYRLQFPDASHFNLFDIRNVPLHIHALFLMPPDLFPDWSVIRPSRYGLSVVFTSPAFIYAFFVRRETPLKAASWIAIALVSVPLFLHYSQGWWQYGYRFLLDFIPFLLILTALGFDDHPSLRSRRIQFALVAWSVMAGVWGLYWANGW